MQCTFYNKIVSKNHIQDFVRDDPQTIGDKAVGNNVCVARYSLSYNFTSSVQLNCLRKERFLSIF